MDEAFLGEKRMHRDRAVILDGSGFFLEWVLFLRPSKPLATGD